MGIRGLQAFRFFREEMVFQAQVQHQVLFAAMKQTIQMMLTSISALGHDRAFTLPSPLQHSSSPLIDPTSQNMARSRSQTNSLSSFAASSNHRKPLSRASSYRAQKSSKIDVDSARDSARGLEQIRKPPVRLTSPRPPEIGEGQDPPNPVSKILSPASINGTPRSSGEFYSLSNNSTETLASEYVLPEASHSLLKPGHSRQSSTVRPLNKTAPEILMMGYGQIIGSYVLDGSLINQGPFEEVKRKAIVGGRGGGGVVRSESIKRDNGLLGSFGWATIGDSLGGLLGGNEISSIKEAKKSGSGRSVPLLSTPQSILFVDLRLDPGQSKSFTYRHPLPRGLPPSHKGKAMKITYNLVVGTQRSTQVAQSNYVQRVEIPFRVLSSVNGMSPRLIPRCSQI